MALLHAKLAEAVADERFEEAAQLRDMIRQEKLQDAGASAPGRAHEGS